MTRYYDVTTEGAGADGQTWTTRATIESEFHDVFETAMEDMFLQLTQGRAEFGNPGVGCNGPYTITRMVIELSPV